MDLLELFIANPSISTDTRTLNKGDIYFALKGENFDGNAYVEIALDKGASWCVSDNKDLLGREKVIIVDNTLKSLQSLATSYRETFQIPVIGITGSNGKTTTKEMIAGVLSQNYRVHYTKGNLNNHIGVPLTLLSMPKETEIAVIEMGANHIGEIAELCRIALPNYGIITNIGKAHIEGFGSAEAIYIAKRELFDFVMQNGGKFFHNIEEKSLDYLIGPENQIISISSFDSPELKLDSDSSLFLKLIWNSEEILTRIFGSYNFNNLLIAARIGQYFGIKEESIKLFFKDFVQSNNRSQTLQIGTSTVILDAYNANPSSMNKAIHNFANLKSEPNHNKVLILGDMLELGVEENDLHADVLKQVKLSGNYHKVILVGPRFLDHAADYPDFHFFASTKDAKEIIAFDAMQNCLILIKGSRGLKMEELLV